MKIREIIDPSSLNEGREDITLLDTLSNFFHMNVDDFYTKYFDVKTGQLKPFERKTDYFVIRKRARELSDKVRSEKQLNAEYTEIFNIIMKALHLPPYP